MRDKNTRGTVFNSLYFLDFEPLLNNDFTLQQRMFFDYKILIGEVLITPSTF